MACEHPHGDEELIKKIKELPLSQRVKVVALYHYTKKKSVLDDELEAKTKSLQKEFDLKALPIYQTQSELITGQRAPSGEELTNLQTYLDGETVNTEVVGPVENFWGKAITNCRAIQEHLNPDGPNDKDGEVLKHLTKVEVKYVENSDDFTLVFTFKENEYFTNTELTKKFYFKEKTQATQASQDHDHHHDHHHEDEDFPSKTEGTEIQWKEGKDVTKKTVSKKQKNKKTGATRTVNKQVQADSFFNFFRTVQADDVTEADEDDEAAGADEKLEIDYEVGRTFTDELIPFSLEYYLGINPEEEDEFDDEDDDKGDDDDDEDSDDDKKKKLPRKKSGDSSKGKKDKKESGDQKPPQDCKQQ